MSVGSLPVAASQHLYLIAWLKNLDALIAEADRAGAWATTEILATTLGLDPCELRLVHELRHRTARETCERAGQIVEAGTTAAVQLIRRGYLDERLVLTREGRLLADAAVRDLLP